MRATLAIALLAAVACLRAEDTAPAPAQPKPAVNTVCPVDGKKVSPTIPPISGTTKEGKTVGIGVCSPECEAKVKAEPQKYADDAVTNRRHAEK